MYPALASAVDLVHALAMVAWVAGLPLLFWRKRPRWTRAYAAYAIVFIALYQISRLFLGECFLTTAARWCWEHGGAEPGTAPNEWFTVRVAMAVFHLAPSHRSITIAGQLLVLVSAVGMLRALERGRTRREVR